MYASEADFLALVAQALGRDIRSVHQRLGVGQVPGTRTSSTGSRPVIAQLSVEGGTPETEAGSLGGSRARGVVPSAVDEVGGAQEVRGGRTAEREALEGGEGNGGEVCGETEGHMVHLVDPEGEAGTSVPYGEVHKGFVSHPLEDVGLAGGQGCAEGGTPAEGLGRSVAESPCQSEGFYHIVLEGVDISYDVVNSGIVHVRSSTLWRPQKR